MSKKSDLSPPSYPQLIHMGYCPQYFGADVPADLAAGYNELRRTDPGGYYLLLDFDHYQGRRDWVYERKSAELHDIPYTPGEPLAHCFPKTPAGQDQLAIAELIAEGYTYREVAELLGISKSTVCIIVQQIRAIMLAHQAEPIKKAGPY